MNRFILFVGPFLVACSGAEQTTLLDDSGTQQQPDSTTPVSDAGTPQDSTTPPDDATLDAPTILDVVTVDVPVKPIDTKIQCGTSTCSAQTQVCCYHVGNTQNQYECVSSLSDCAGQADVPVSCSSGDNCTSQGHTGYICCAEPNGPNNPSVQCNGFTSAASVACAQTCSAQNGEFQVGCSVQLQNCLDTQATCALSTCSLPGFDICK